VEKNPAMQYITLDWSKARQAFVDGKKIVRVPTLNINKLQQTNKTAKVGVMDTGGGNEAEASNYYNPEHPPELFFVQDTKSDKPDSLMTYLLNFEPTKKSSEFGQNGIWTGKLYEWDLRTPGLRVQEMAKNVVNDKYMIVVMKTDNSSLKVKSFSLWSWLGDLFGDVGDFLNYVGYSLGIPGTSKVIADITSSTGYTTLTRVWGFDFGGGGGSGGGGGGTISNGAGSTVYFSYLPMPGADASSWLQYLNITPTALAAPLYDPNNPFSDLETPPTTAADMPLIQNGIDIADVVLDLHAPPSTSTFTPIVLGSTINRHPGIAEDMTYGTDGDMTGILAGRASHTDQELFDNLTTLVHETTVFDMGLKTVGDMMVNKFQGGSGGTFENPILNDRVGQSSALKNFGLTFGLALNNALKGNGGDITTIPKINIDNKDRPIFNGLYNKFAGLQILVNDTEYSDITVDDFAILNGHWSATITISILDHFGLDKHDALTYQNPPLGHPAFADWWILQHVRGYQPFLTIIKVRKLLSGDIN